MASRSSPRTTLPISGGAAWRALAALSVLAWGLPASGATTVRFPFDLTPETTLASVAHLIDDCFDPPTYGGFMRICSIGTQGEDLAAVNVGFARRGADWQLAQVQLVERNSPSPMGSMVDFLKRSYGIDRHTVDRNGEVLFHLDGQDDWLLTASLQADGGMCLVHFYYVPLMQLAIAHGEGRR